MKRLREFLGRFTCLLFLTAVRCATAHNGRYQQISVTTTPPGAEARLLCTDTHSLPSLTPTEFRVDRKAVDCVVKISKEGFDDVDIKLQKKFSKRAANDLIALPLLSVAGSSMGGSGKFYGDRADWTSSGVLAGAAVSGSALFVDVATGAIHQFSPGKIDVTLTPQSEQSAAAH